MGERSEKRMAWCEVDGCPSDICNGPHIGHHCPNGDLVVARYDDPSSCPFCGHPGPGSPQGSTNV